MIHVKDIKAYIDAGEIQQAKDGLDSILMLGPSNIEALKLKATLLQMEGRYEEQTKVWQQIASIDAEDVETILYFQRRFIDERENYYYTEEAQGGGRRFLAMPKSLFHVCIFGLVGCITFLRLPSLTQNYPDFLGPQAFIGAFAVLVLLPWVAVMFYYVVSLRWVEISKSGILFKTKLQNREYRWDEFASICVCHSFGHRQYMGLILKPKDSAKKAVFLNLSENDSVVRARPFLISELRRHYPQLEFLPYEQLSSVPKKLILF